MTLQQIIKEFNPLHISIDINVHKGYYQTSEEHLKEVFQARNILDEIDKTVLEQIYKLDNVVEIVCYPKNPASFYKIYHYDLDLALEEMYNILKRNQ